MNRNILSLTNKSKTMVEHSLSNFESTKAVTSDNPIYEDPRDVIGKIPKSKHRRITVNSESSSPNFIKADNKTLLKEQKRKLTKKYESLIITLMDRCEENALVMNEKESYIIKLKDKLKAVLKYNTQFADDNDLLKKQHSSAIKYVDDCKCVVDELEKRTRELEDKNEELEARNRELESKVKHYDLPNKENPISVPLVEVCMSCTSREILLRQAREQNSRLLQDMQAMKDVLYRLNIQLSHYQEKFRRVNKDILPAEPDAVFLQKAADRISGNLETSIIASSGHPSSLGHKGADNPVLKSSNQDGDHSLTGRTVNFTSLLSAQALVPLFDAYQDSIQEKENLIVDYEKQFENFNRKTKQVVNENTELSNKLTTLEEEISSLRHTIKKLSVEKETLEIDKATLTERTEKSESKLKEVYELYEDKIAAMMRDYETIHREYFATKNALAVSDGRATSAEAALRSPGLRTVPADLHERRIEDCKRLFDELKHQYNMESEKRSEHINKLQEEKNSLEDKYKIKSEELENAKTELKNALKNVKLYRRAAVIFRQRLKASVASVNTLRKYKRRLRLPVTPIVTEPTRETLQKVEKIKTEIKNVKVVAYRQLEELERRIREREIQAAHEEAEHSRELQRAQLVVEHKERIIRSLIDKVADVEEVRLSQSNSHRLQGIIDQSPIRQPEPETRNENENEKRGQSGVKLVPGYGGYFQDIGREVVKKK